MNKKTEFDFKLQKNDLLQKYDLSQNVIVKRQKTAMRKTHFIQKVIDLI